MNFENKDKYYTDVITTDHYEFLLHSSYRYNKDRYTSIHLYVGDKARSSLSITLPYEQNDNYDPPYESNVGNIGHIKKFREGLLKPVSDEIWRAHSFASEMLTHVMKYIRTHFPYIKHLTLTDDSQLICSSNPLDKLDLLYYHVAVHKKTWYEQEFNAYFTPRDEFIRYKCQIETYASSMTKLSMTWEDIESRMYKGMEIVYNFIKTNPELCKKTYEEAKTLPEFFKAFGKFFSYEERCFVFKEWIERFIREWVRDIPRDWVIDMYQVEETQTTQKGSAVSTRRKTRRKARKGKK